MQQLPTKSYYTTFISSFGAAIEYYSFITYIMLSNYLSILYFPNSNPHIRMLNALLLFAVGYAVTPISAVIFSFFADRTGRKPTMLMALALMAAATFLMGLVPSYQTIGISATLIFFVLRILQGLAQGAELPSAITFISEHAKDKQQGRFCGFLFFAIGTGALLSALVNYIITSVLSEQAMYAYGFRIPFLLAGVLGIIGYKIRKNTTETPLFLAHKKQEKQKKVTLVRIPIVTVLKDYFPKLLIGFGLVWSGAVLVNFGLFLPSFLQIHFGYLPEDTYLVTTLAFLLDFLLIFLGIIADKITFRRLYLIGVIVNMIAIYPVFLLLKFKGFGALFIFVQLYHLLILCLAACYPSMLTRLFPTKVRFSGVSLSYLSAYSLAGFVPLIINSFFVRFPYVITIAGCIFLSLVVSFVAGLCYRDSKL